MATSQRYYQLKSDCGSAEGQFGKSLKSLCKPESNSLKYTNSFSSSKPSSFDNTYASTQFFSTRSPSKLSNMCWTDFAVNNDLLKKITQTKNDLFEMRSKNNFSPKTKEELRTNRLVMKSHLQNQKTILSSSFRASSPSQYVKFKLNNYRESSKICSFKSFLEEGNKSQNPVCHYKKLIVKPNFKKETVSTNSPKIRNAINDIVLNSQQSRFFERKFEIIRHAKSKSPENRCSSRLALFSAHHL